MVSTLARTPVVGETAVALGRNAVEREAIRLIEELDLEPIVYKLVTPAHDEPAKMTLAEADATVVLYRQFLILNVLYPDQKLVPSHSLDEVWHTHILDTEKYAEDCQRIFGRMLHHFPYRGMRGAQDVQNWQQASAGTNALFQEYFGITLIQNVSAGECASHCGGDDCCNGFKPSKPDETSDKVRPRPDRSLLAV